MRKSIAHVVWGVGTLGACVLATALSGCREATDPAEEILAAYRQGGHYDPLAILYPLDETVFPPEIASPIFRWEQSSLDADRWLVTFEFPDGQPPMSFFSRGAEWSPSDEQWEIIKRRSLGRKAKVTVLGVNRARQDEILSAASITISTSPDEVGAPIFYRAVNLPFADAVKDPSRIRWRFGDIASKERPPVILEELPVCGNCHSFSADGDVLGLDVDYANDKGSYAITPVEKEMTLDHSKIITWSDYRSEDREPTFGLLSQVSPDGRYVVSTVKDRSVFVARDDLAFSQLFFPIKGILVVYDRETKRFRALPGADDKQFVQSNPSWSPDGKYIVFARAKAYRLEGLRSEEKVLLSEEECREFLEEGKTFLFDLYRIPFHGGEGGRAEPLEGASQNGMSNYFARYSPDGKWIVFCKAKSFMLLQPDSALYIIPASGGKARRLRCNTPRMNSWHSWSPNGKWLVFSSKAYSVYTQLLLTHIDEQGQSTPPVVLANFTEADRAANIPEFVNASHGTIKKIREEFLDDVNYLRAGDAFHDQNDLENAIRLYRKALEVNANNALAHANCGVCLLKQGKLEEAKAHFVRAIELQPDLATAHCNLGTVLRRENKLTEAADSYREALRLDPDFVAARLRLGTLLLDLGELEEAQVHLSEAVRLDPRNPFGHLHLGVAFLRDGQPEKTAVHLQHALEQDPDFVPALVTLAVIRAASHDDALRDGQEAVELAWKALELTRDANPEALHALAAAYAEVGRFSEAVATAELAIRAARAAGNEDMAAAIQQTLELYRQRKPFRSSFH